MYRVVDKLRHIVIELHDIARELGDDPRAGHLRDVAHLLDCFITRYARVANIGL